MIYMIISFCCPNVQTHHLGIPNVSCFLGPATINKPGLPGLQVSIYPLVMTNSLPWKDPPMLLIGKPSISIRAIYTMANC